MKQPQYIDIPFEEWRQSFSFFTEVSVRFSETDMFGHMNNVTPFIYFEEARIAYFKQRGITAQNSETMTVVASQQCDYMRQVMPYENLRIYVKASGLPEMRPSPFITLEKMSRACRALQVPSLWFKCRRKAAKRSAGRSGRKAFCSPERITISLRDVTSEAPFTYDILTI